MDFVVAKSAPSVRAGARWRALARNALAANYHMGIFM
jgi:hypothetical protein